jgi:predicted transcriptional regulator
MKRLPESELDIMIIVWSTEGPVSVTYILEKLNADKKLTISALHSYLRRLVEKGFLKCYKQGKQNVYEAIVTEEEYQQEESSSVLKKLYGGSLKNFVAALYNSEQLTKKDIVEVREFIETFDKKEGK